MSKSALRFFDIISKIITVALVLLVLYFGYDLVFNVDHSKNKLTERDKDEIIVEIINSLDEMSSKYGLDIETWELGAYFDNEDITFNEAKKLFNRLNEEINDANEYIKKIYETIQYYENHK